MGSHSKWGDLGPYLLKDEKERILENIWQFSKIYEKTRKTTERSSRWDKTIIWEQNEEDHAIKISNEITEEENTEGEGYFILRGQKYKVTKEYTSWRKRGKNSRKAIRYPNGYHGKTNVLTVLSKNDYSESLADKKWKSFTYIEARKALYCPWY